MCFQYFIETQLVLHCHSETVHLRSHTLQELVSGMESLDKVIIDFYLVPDDISKRGLIRIEILPIATLLAVVEGEIGLVLP